MTCSLTLTGYSAVGIEDVSVGLIKVNRRGLGRGSHFQNVGLNAMARAETEVAVSAMLVEGACKLTVERCVREIYHLVHYDGTETSQESQL